MVQSPLSQPMVNKNKELYKDFFDFNSPIEDYTGEQGKESIKLMEGILIELFRKKQGFLPKWNKIGGAIYGQRRAKNMKFDLLEAINSFEYNPLVARSSLRELSNNPVYAEYEMDLHAVRMNMFNLGISFNESFKVLKEMCTISQYKNIEESNYLCKNLDL